MKSIEIKGTARPVVGKKSTRDIRKADSIPAVLYGVERGENNLPVATHFTVTNDEVRNLIYSPHIYSVDLVIDGKACKAVLKDLQFHPVTDRILHIDFYQITEEKPIVMEVPVALEDFAVNFINMSINKAVDDFNVGDVDMSSVLGGLL